MRRNSVNDDDHASVNDDDHAATSSSSSISTPKSTIHTESITVQHSSSGIKPDNHRHNDDDDDCHADNNDRNNDNEPLLSSFFKKNVKMGPFTIQYNNPSSPRAKPSRLYEDPSSHSLYRDFIKSNDPDAGCQEEDEDGDNDDELFHRHHPRQHVSITHSILHKLQSTKCCKRFFLPLRILILALYLAFTLSSFWILDSIKEPTLAILVNGELGKHQPRAKMVSFVVVVVMAVAMEWADRVKQRRRRERRKTQQQTRGGNEELDGVNAALEKSWADRNLPNSMRDDNDKKGSSRWRKMGIRTSRFWNHFHWGSHGNRDDEASSKITTLAFYVVGSLYIHFFVTVAVALRQHPSFRPANVAADTSSASNANKDWYYPTLGYILFALIESFGSVSITIFWAFANSHMTLEAAERHYGSIVALAQAGAIAGSTLSAVLGRRREKNTMYDEEGRVDVSGVANVGVEEAGDAQVTPMLIFWACGCIGCGMAIMALYSQLFSTPMKQSNGRQGLVLHSDTEDGIERVDEDEHPPIVQSKLRQLDDRECNSTSNSILRDLFGGLHLIFRHEYLKLLLAVSVLYEIALTCMHYEMNLIGLDRFGVGISIVDESELNEEQHDYDHTNSDNTEAHQNNGSDEGITYIQFMGWYGQTVNILSLFLSFYAFPHLIKNYGLAFTIRVFPTVLLVVTISAFVIFPGNLYFLFISLSLCKALTYSVHDPSEEVLYMPTSDDAKFRAKFWIDVVGQRIAKAIGSAINNYAGSVEGIVKYGSLPSVVASLALWLACYQVGIVFNRLIKNGGVVGLEEERYHEEGLELCEGIDDGDETGDDNLEDEMVPTTSSERRLSKVETTLL